MGKQHESGREEKKKPKKSLKERKLEKLQKKFGPSDPGRVLKIDHSHNGATA